MKKIISIYTLFLLLAFAVCAHAGTITYTYDNAGGLTKADYGSGKSITYTYDNAGNLLNETASSPTAEGPDLTAKVLKPPATVKVGKVLRINCIVKNIGKTKGSFFKVGFYLSTNNEKSISEEDTPRGEKSLSGLKKSESKKVIYKWKIPADLQKGDYYLKAVADTEDSVSESNEDNNIGVSARFRVK